MYVHPAAPMVPLVIAVLMGQEHACLWQRSLPSFMRIPGDVSPLSHTLVRLGQLCSCKGGKRQLPRLPWFPLLQLALHPADWPAQLQRHAYDEQWRKLWAGHLSVSEQRQVPLLFTRVRRVARESFGKRPCVPCTVRGVLVCSAAVTDVQVCHARSCLPDG